MLQKTKLTQIFTKKNIMEQFVYKEDAYQIIGIEIAVYNKIAHQNVTIRKISVRSAYRKKT